MSVFPWGRTLRHLLTLSLVVFAVTACSAGESNYEASVPAENEKPMKPVTDVDQSKLAAQSYPMIAANMLDRVIHGQDVSQHMKLLKEADPDKLAESLNTDELRRSFWIDIYNGYTQYFLKTDPKLYKEDRNAFFKKDQIAIAGYNLCMNDIEHGALRRGATIWSKGNVRIPWRNSFVRHFKVEKVDYRIHFALNCGARSCPPVCVYLPERADEQLDAASKSYLTKECSYDKEENTVEVPALMTWFSDDFSTGEGKRAILVRNGIIPEGVKPKIEYKDYDWDMQVANYKQF